MGLFNFIKKLVNESQHQKEYSERFESKVNERQDISEPVISLVKCFNENPKRFKLEAIRGEYSYFLGQKYLFSDLKENLSWDFNFRSVYYERTGKYEIDGVPSFLSKAEVKYLVKHIGYYYLMREVRYNGLKEDRKNRLHTKQRKALMKVYCK